MKRTFFLVIFSALARLFFTKPMENPTRQLVGKASTLMVRACDECQFLFALFTSNASELEVHEQSYCPRCGHQGNYHYGAIHLDKVELIEGRMRAKAAKAISR